MVVSSAPGDVLVTYSLGSCVGLALFDPAAGVGGLIHCMLPVSSLNPEKAAAQPAMFVDTGAVALLQAMCDHGAERRRLVAKVAGGAAPLGDQHTFRIGERNHTVLRKVLWKNNILLAGEAIGGTAARTMFLFCEDGHCVVRSHGQDAEL